MPMWKSFLGDFEAPQQRFLQFYAQNQPFRPPIVRQKNPSCGKPCVFGESRWIVIGTIPPSFLIFLKESCKKIIYFFRRFFSGVFFFGRFCFVPTHDTQYKTNLAQMPRNIFRD